MQQREGGGSGRECDRVKWWWLKGGDDSVRGE